jgi:hypothetical protein
MFGALYLLDNNSNEQTTVRLQNPLDEFVKQFA